jgi:peptidoglycan/xylan/chitin deacetylase (PgdA/CDA1 family)
MAKLAVSMVYYLAVVLPRSMLSVLGARLAGTIIVLQYHGVKPDQRQRFGWQMDAVRRAGRPTALGGESLGDGGERRIAVTFDDGFANIVENAWPELEAQRIPATVFVPSGELGFVPKWEMAADCADRGERIMTADELCALGIELLTVGSHTVSHTTLLGLPDEEALEELCESKRRLEVITKREVSLVAFPYGDYTERTVELAKGAGYRHGYSIEPTVARCDAGDFVCGRFRVDFDYSGVEFWLLVRGAYAWLGSLQRLKRRFGEGRQVRRGVR